MAGLFPILSSGSSLCGDCTLCCTVMGIGDMPVGDETKPPNQTCKYVQKDDTGCMGCSIYKNKPASCTEYKCLWLALREAFQDDQSAPDEMRPDRCHAVMNPLADDSGITVWLEPGHPNAWQHPAVNAMMEIMVRGGRSAVVRHMDDYWKYEPNGSLTKLKAVSKGEEVTMLEIDKDAAKHPKQL